MSQDAKKKIVFLLGSANMSGGTYVIFQHALYLQSQGYSVTVALVYMNMNELLQLKNSNSCWHPAIKQLNFVALDEAKQYQYDIAIFTWWATVFYLDQVQSEHKIYFVQSIESRFYPQQSTFMRDLVYRSYKLDLPVITEASWIQQFLTTQFNNTCYLVKNGILKSLYTTTGQACAKKSESTLRILVEGPMDAIYKNVPKTIELCKQANVGEVWLLTSSTIQQYPNVDRVFSQVPIDSVPDIYRACDVIVKLSFVEGMFGPPLEMFHCGGTAIVYNVTGHDEYIKHDYNALVAKTNDERAVVEYLQALNNDRRLLQRLQQGAIETANAWCDWNQSSSEFADTLGHISSQPLNNTKQTALYDNFQKYFREYITVDFTTQTSSVKKTLSANPTQNSGFYTLQIPLDAQTKQLKILFGKNYKHICLASFFLIKRGKLSQQMSIEDFSTALTFNATDITQIENNIYDCHTKSSGIQVKIRHNSLNHAEFDYYLQTEFNPISIHSSHTHKDIINF